MHRPSRIAPLLSLVCLVAVTACSSSETKPAQPRYTGPGTAAEPATSPPVTGTPAGSSSTAGPAAEGIVADPETKTLSVLVRDPNRLLIYSIAAEAPELLRSVSLPGKARHLSLAKAGGPVLIADEGSESLLEVTVPAGAITRTAVRHFPHDAAQTTNGRIVVADEGGRSLSVVENNEEIFNFNDVSQPAGVAAIGDSVGVVDAQKSTVSTYDTQSLRRTGRVPAGNGPTHIATAPGSRFLVVDTRGNALLLFTAALARAGSLPLPGTPYGVAVDAAHDTAWVTLTARNEVVGVSLGKKPAVVARYRTVRQPNTVAVDPSTRRVFVAGAAEGQIQTITTR